MNFVSRIDKFTKELDKNQVFLGLNRLKVSATTIGGQLLSRPSLTLADLQSLWRCFDKVIGNGKTAKKTKKLRENDGKMPDLVANEGMRQETKLVFDPKHSSRFLI